MIFYRIVAYLLCCTQMLVALAPVSFLPRAFERLSTENQNNFGKVRETLLSMSPQRFHLEIYHDQKFLHFVTCRRTGCIHPELQLDLFEEPLYGDFHQAILYLLQCFHRYGDYRECQVSKDSTGTSVCLEKMLYIQCNHTWNIGESLKACLFERNGRKNLQIRTQNGVGDYTLQRFKTSIPEILQKECMDQPQALSPFQQKFFIVIILYTLMMLLVYGYFMPWYLSPYQRRQLQYQSELDDEGEERAMVTDTIGLSDLIGTLLIGLMAGGVFFFIIREVTREPYLSHQQVRFLSQEVDDLIYEYSLYQSRDMLSIDDGYSFSDEDSSMIGNQLSSINNEHNSFEEDDPPWVMLGAVRPVQCSCLSSVFHASYFTMA